MMSFMEIPSITISAKCHEKGGQFSLQKAATALGLGPDSEIALTVRKLSGELVFHGVTQMGSGFEVYGVEVKGLGSNEPIIVEVSLPPPRGAQI
jgi:hypothetical protein